MSANAMFILLVCSFLIAWEGNRTRVSIQKSVEIINEDDQFIGNFHCYCRKKKSVRQEETARLHLN